MIPSFCSRAALLFIALTYFSATQSAGSLTPEITAQGFDMTVAQEGLLGAFGRTRVRFEVPDRIEKLYVKERSYAVDLATTPEMAHFPLFGLKTQVRHQTDVTLNFQNYINEKVEEAGTFAFELLVTDRKGKSASARLLIQVTAPPPFEEQSGEDSVEARAFRFVRNGVSAVSGADLFGITWRTIKSDEVVIELTKRDNGASKIVEIAPSDYDKVSTRKQLEQKIASRSDTPSLHLTASGGKTTGLAFGVINQDRPYLLKVTWSDTSLSRSGTTVTLAGEYKH
jgi:hypothetical protein